MIPDALFLGYTLQDGQQKNGNLLVAKTAAWRHPHRNTQGPVSQTPIHGFVLGFVQGRSSHSLQFGFMVGSLASIAQQVITQSQRTGPDENLLFTSESKPLESSQQSCFVASGILWIPGSES